jgi:dTDP-4-dehydrorhamnose 3,5-epimerase
MQFEALPIEQAFLVRAERHVDLRGFFARTFCVQEFANADLPTAVVQTSISFNGRRGTVRGMHLQWPPSHESKLVRCLRGALFDVLLDLRPNSASYLRHISVELDDENRDAVFIPHGVAHGFQTLTDATEVLYQMTDFHSPELATGVRWSDPSFGIAWPLSDKVVISERDANYPDFDCRTFEAELARRAARGPDSSVDPR